MKSKIVREVVISTVSAIVAGMIVSAIAERKRRKNLSVIQGGKQ